jgi:hypothetical protein
MPRPARAICRYPMMRVAPDWWNAAFASSLATIDRIRVCSRSALWLSDQGHLQPRSPAILSHLGDSRSIHPDPQSDTESVSPPPCSSAVPCLPPATPARRLRKRRGTSQPILSVPSGHIPSSCLLFWSKKKPPATCVVAEGQPIVTSASGRRSRLLPASQLQQFTNSHLLSSCAATQAKMAGG